MQQQTSPAGRRVRLWLAAADGHTLKRPEIAPINEPELPMAVRFEGLSRDQQQAALSAFPGGRRFVLVG